MLSAKEADYASNHDRRVRWNLTLVSALCATASAQERGNSYLTERLDAPSDALELKVGTGYTQGFGNAAPGRGMTDVAGAGVGFSADIDYRINPRWSVGVMSQYQQFTSELNSSSYGLAFNLGATYHFAPILRGDPWLRLATGYRFLWENNVQALTNNGANLITSNVTVLRHGLEIANLQLGYDIRISEATAIAPVVGADVSLFLWEDPSVGSNMALSPAQAAASIYAGVQGRFDVGGSTASSTAVTAATVPAAQAEAPPPPAPPPETKPVAPSIAVSQDVLEQCKLQLASVEKAPKFDFNDTELLPEDMAVLKQIGDCFASGPMKGMGVLLVGRADPRGTVSYNQDLGKRRAQRVAEYLETLGVDSSKIEEQSRGKLDASGHNEETWRTDRRVDILQH